jgi:DNA (cytosine-5)-methyltransferase 1
MKFDEPVSAPLTCSQYSAVAIGCDTYNGSLTGDVAATLSTGGATTTGSGPNVLLNARVRRLTPMECERLQGFPDRYTAIPKAKDGPRYKALGNSMAVPVMRWIGQSIDYAMIWSTP